MTHGSRGHAGKVASALPRSKAFPVNRKPSLVPPIVVGEPDRSAEVNTILVLPVRRFPLVKEVPGIELIVAEELPKGAMKLVGSRTGSYVDVGAGGDRKLRVRNMRLNIEFL